MATDVPSLAHLRKSKFSVEISKYRVLLACNLLLVYLPVPYKRTNERRFATRLRGMILFPTPSLTFTSDLLHPTFRKTRQIYVDWQITFRTQ